MDFADFAHYDAQLRRAGTDRDSNAAKIRELTTRIGEMEVAVEEQSVHITSLETALTATIRTLAFGATTIPTWDDHLHQHNLASTETALHLARAAQVLGLDLVDLGLAHAVTCPHGDDPALCNECRGICDDSP